MTDDTEHHEWRDLVASPGWVRLKAHAEAEWTGPAFTNLVEALANKPDDLEALSKLRQVLAARKAIDRLFRVPGEQMAKLAREAVSDDTARSRRGPL